MTDFATTFSLNTSVNAGSTGKILKIKEDLMSLSDIDDLTYRTLR